MGTMQCDCTETRNRKNSFADEDRIIVTKLNTFSLDDIRLETPKKRQKIRSAEKRSESRDSRLSPRTSRGSSSGRSRSSHKRVIPISNDTGITLDKTLLNKVFHDHLNHQLELEKQRSSGRRSPKGHY